MRIPDKRVLSEEGTLRLIDNFYRAFYTNKEMPDHYTQLSYYTNLEMWTRKYYRANENIKQDNIKMYTKLLLPVIEILHDFSKPKSFKDAIQIMTEEINLIKRINKIMQQLLADVEDSPKGLTIYPVLPYMADSIERVGNFVIVSKLFLEDIMEMNKGTK